MDKTELVICSIGLKKEHITLETMAALKNCRSIYTCISDHKLNRFLSGFCQDIITDKAGTPEKTAQAALKQLKKTSPMAFLTYGNPFFLSMPAYLLWKKASVLGVKIRTLEGISSIDALFNLLRLSGEDLRDVRLVNVGGYKTRRLLRTDADTLYFMVGWLAEKGRGLNLKKFLADLGRVYPPGFPAALVNCPDSRLRSGRVVETTVGKLGKALRSSDQATTLFIRKLEGRPAG